jgi:hypothetical protein
MSLTMEMHVEIKIGGQWLHYQRASLEGDLSLFVKMTHYFGFRHELIVAEKLPATDKSETTEFCLQKDLNDTKRISWADKRELAAIEKWWEQKYPSDPFGFTKKIGWLFGSTYQNFAGNHPGDFPKELEDVRAIFWLK